jgi:hypothetical protein
MEIGTGKKKAKLVRKAQECAVCTEKFNLTVRKRIKCKYCSYESCRECNVHYLTSAGGDAKCMNCQKIWIRDDMIDMFGKGFVDSVYKKVRGQYLYDMLKLRIPELQPLALRFRTARAEYWEALRRRDHHLLYRQIEVGKIANVVNDRSMNFFSEGGVKPTGEIAADRVVKRCPCNGMVMRSNMKCGNCEMQYCKDCLEQKEDGHKCDEATVQTVTLLARDTKPCPKCTCAITKIDGCDQMWCPECKTAFSWNTGKIETGLIHNPHYYQWMRQNGGQEELERQARAREEAHENECGDITYQQGTSIIARLMTRIGTIRDMGARCQLSDMIRFCSHVQAVEIPDYLIKMERNQRVDDLIIKFLLNDIGEKELVSEIMKRDKAASKARDIMTVLQTFRLVILNSFVQIHRAIKNDVPEMLVQSMERFTDIVEFCNKSFDRIHEVYADTAALHIYKTDGYELNKY